jgi:isoleucyl-tRNA synthetase
MLPKVEGREASVHLALFPELQDVLPEDVKRIEADWEQLLTIRSEVLAKLERLRAEKAIGKSLEATVSLFVVEPSEERAMLTNYAPALPELFNVSEVDLVAVATNDTDYVANMEVRRSNQPKCARCWRYVPDVGSESKYPTVCLRCAEALAAIGFPPYSAEGAA